MIQPPPGTTLTYPLFPHTPLCRSTHCPAHRPRFLFSRSERIAHPFSTLEAGHAMLIERQAMKAELEQCRRQMHALREQHESFLKQSVVISACSQGNISDRAETTYLKIGRASCRERVCQYV